MKKIAVFGNAGGGKSTLSRRLAEATGLPWRPLDCLKYRPGGDEVPHDEYKAAHDELMQRDQWIIDGFGSPDTLWPRLDAADTLVYVDLPLVLHYWWVTKRLLKSPWKQPVGWPAGSPLWQGTMNSYRTVGLCHAKLTPRYRDYVAKARASRQVHHLHSRRAIRAFLVSVESGFRVDDPRDCS